MKRIKNWLWIGATIFSLGMALTVSGTPALAQSPPLTLSEQELEEPLPDNFEKGNRWVSLDYQMNQIEARFGQPFGVALQKARYLVRQKRYKEACETFALAAKIQPERFPFDEWGDILEARGDYKQAIKVYRQAVYNAGLTPDGKPVHDFMEDDGSRVYARVQSETVKKEIWQSAVGQDVGVLMRYALLLERHQRYEEALVVYEWGRKRTFAGEGRAFPSAGVLEDSFRLGPMFALDMTRTTLKYSAAQRVLFEAAAHTLMGYRLGSFRSRREYEWTNYARIPEYRTALALQPDFAPTKLFLALAYLQEYTRPELRKEGIATLETMRNDYAHPGIQMRAIEKLSEVYKEEEFYRQEAIKASAKQTP